MWKVKGMFNISICVILIDICWLWGPTKHLHFFYPKKNWISKKWLPIYCNWVTWLKWNTTTCKNISSLIFTQISQNNTFIFSANAVFHFLFIHVIILRVKHIFGINYEKQHKWMMSQYQWDRWRFSAQTT